MPTFITFWKYTKEGLVDIRNTPERFKTVNDIVKALGGKVIVTYGLLGEYDVVTIMELPDEKAAASAILKICSRGRITAQTMTAIPIDDFLKITKESSANPNFVIDRSCS